MNELIAHPDVDENTSNSPLYVNMVLSDPEVILAAREYPEGRARTEFLQTALKIGVLSLRTARGVIDGDAVRKEGERLMTSLSERLNGWRDGMERQVVSSLGKYFDPNTGLFVDRVDRLVKSDGELATLMQSQVSEAQKSLSTLFQQFISENTQLLKALDPSEENALISSMKKAVDGVIQASNLQVVSQFSLDNKDGALSRFMGELTQKHGHLTDALSKKMSNVVDEFSLDKQDSALSRLVKRVEVSQYTVTSQLSLDNPESALSRMQTMLQLQHKQNIEVTNQLSKTLEIAVSQLQTRRSEAVKSTQHGLAFEEAVGHELRQIAAASGDVLEDVGTSTGIIPNSKVGDFLMTVGPEKVASGARVVWEAKASGAYDLSKTLAEADVARRNRQAGVCIFVHSERTAQPSIPVFARYGHDIVLRWNEEDPATDVWLKAAGMVATALSVRAAAHDKKDAASFKVVDGAIERIRKQIEGFEEIRKSATTSKSASEKILERGRIMEDALIAQLATIADEFEKLKLRENSVDA
jgi:hypothetical protein